MRPIIQPINHTLHTLPALHFPILPIRLPILHHPPFHISQLIIRPTHRAQRREVPLRPHLAQPSGDNRRRDECRHNAIHSNILVPEQRLAYRAREAHARVLRGCVLRRDGERILADTGCRDDNLWVEEVEVFGGGGEVALRFAAVVHEELESVEDADDVDVHAESVGLRRLGVEIEGLENVLLVACAGVGGEEVDAVSGEAGRFPVVCFFEERGVVVPGCYIGCDEFCSSIVEARLDGFPGFGADVSEDNTPIDIFFSKEMLRENESNS